MLHAHGQHDGGRALAHTAVVCFHGADVLDALGGLLSWSGPPDADVCILNIETASTARPGRGAGPNVEQI